MAIGVYSLFSYKMYQYLLVLEKKGIHPDYYSPIYIYGDIANCFIYTLIGFIFYYVSQNFEQKARWLLYYPMSLFWVMLALTYVYNRAFDNFIQFNRLYIVILGIVIILPVCYIISLLISYFKK